MGQAAELALYDQLKRSTDPIADLYLHHEVVGVRLYPSLRAEFGGLHALRRNGP